MVSRVTSPPKPLRALPVMGTLSPTVRSCHSGRRTSALCMSAPVRFSSQSLLRKPARSCPIASSHGQTAAGGASMEMARVK